ncbi:ATP-dependent Clp protease ATP-binding subunit ClpC [Gimesia maris]|uniref:AAA family ATPase n=1 Tax=Gimesia maris TaxID=122 RepID=UPI00118889AE|nr:AAA family ATPase [Gimesia maris]QDT76778.1 ATP-dependent Clp protease ATP-binding subunit ClpC [Gimesia maris]
MSQGSSFINVQEAFTGPSINSAFEFLSELMPAQNITEEILQAGADYSSFVSREYQDSNSNETFFQRMARGLYRDLDRHLILSGQKGIGKTAVVNEFARLALENEFPFLSQKTFLWFDCSAVGSEDSRGCLESLLAVAQEQPGTVLCIQGFSALFHRQNGCNNRALIKAAARRPEFQLIGLMQPWEYNDLIGSDTQLREFFNQIELLEPDDSTTLEITELEAKRLRQLYDINISPSAVKRAVSLSSSYLFQESQPGKSIKILKRACEDAQFENSQLAKSVDEITPTHIDAALSEYTGIPQETISGTSEEVDFQTALSSLVVGQNGPVTDIASELQMIKAGLTDPGKPAGVYLFAGMTGVGKTELARRVAEFYSGTRRLNTYTMGNFSESHSVSGIIGVPPGYVGHEAGGRLINELNSDPYAVFLLDEAEKAHPNVWKPFLNLFDEGWIVDQRGVKAYADRAIFILTTNSGSDAISQMVRSNKSMEEIEERVKQTLSRVRQERSSQPVFTPQFLARIQRTVVFSPLDEEAMLKVTRLILKRVTTTWLGRRDKIIVVSDSLISALAKEAYRKNEKSGGKEGGRIIRKLISELIERRIQEETIIDKQRYQISTCITLELSESHDSVIQDETGQYTSIMRDMVIVKWRSDTHRFCKQQVFPSLLADGW